LLSNKIDRPFANFFLLAGRWWATYQDRRNLVEDRVSWQYDTNATAYIQELLATEPKLVEVISEGEVFEGHLEVTEMVNVLQRNELATSPTLVVPPSTRGMWDEVVRSTCAEVSDQRVLVVGSPGVGKSRSINHFIREVVHAHRLKGWAHPMPVIVFEHRKDKTVWLFAPLDPASRRAEYEAFSVDRSEFSERKVAALHCPTNYYIVDSSQAEAGSSAPALLPATTVFVCSPDARHYSEWLKDIQRGFRIYCPSWSPGALLAGRPYMSDLGEEEVSRRMEIVGPIPRRVFATMPDFEAFRRKIDSALRDNQADIEAVLREGAEGIEAEHNHDGKPRSSVFSYGVLEGDYKTPTVHFVSDYARLRVGFNVLKMVFSSVQHNADPRRSTELAHTFERLTFVLLRGGWQAQLSPLLPSVSGREGPTIAVLRGPALALPGGKGLWGRMISQMRLMPLWDGCSPLPLASPVLAASNFLLIDVADARNRGFNMTVGRTHAMPTLSQVKKLRDLLGLEEGQLLHVVYLVLPAHFSSFNLSWPSSDVDRLHSRVRVYKAEVPSPLTEPGESMWRTALEEWNATTEQV
jgi:hypothetical protein